MDIRYGLDYIVENKEHVQKLGTALDTTNVTVKKQIFELLSALCAYNAEGYARAIETLEYYKNLKGTRYRFKIVVTELDEPKTSTEYQVVLLAFINCMIISTPCLQDRVRIRNEFIGLKILPVLNNIRRVSGDVADIAVQLDVFNEQRECDDAQSLQGPSDINLNSHLDVFYAILGQVADTPQEIPFLNILQHLLRIDSKEAISDIIWDTAETLVHRATLVENHEDSTRLLRTPSIHKLTCPNCRCDISSPNRKQSLAPTTPTIQLSTSPSGLLTTSSSSTTIPIAPIPPPPPPLMANMNSRSLDSSPAKIFISSPTAPPMPPPPIPSLLTANAGKTDHFSRPSTPDLVDAAKLLPQQETPLPKAKMKTINWNKIPPNKVMGKNNIWKMVADSHQHSPMTELDWGEMEGLFCQQASSNQGSPKMNRDTHGGSYGGADASNGIDRKSRKENSEIVLLDGKRSLNINIFLKQFRTSNEDIIQLIKDGEHDVIGAEKLRGLLKILPEKDEIEMLKTFDGDKLRLGNAEKFLMLFSHVPNYKLRVESMLLKEEFASNMSYLEPSINAMIFAGDDLMNNTLLREVLYMVVVAGNFLNAGGYAGNAAGVKLSSLQKLTDIRANKPGMNLIHFVALQAEKRNRELITFPENLTTLENASRTTMDQITNEINALDTRISKIKTQVDKPTTEIDLKQQTTEFLQMAESKVQMLQDGMKEVENVRLQLAEFFCEDPNSFKLEECFKVFQNFCDKFKQAVNDNERRRLQEEQSTLRRKLREEQMAKRSRQNLTGTPVSDSDMMDVPFDLRASPAMVRRRIGKSDRDDSFSPDITPTGSLRRRRSRVLSEEDDNSLMDFLRSSGHDDSRERKPSSYGSLDRSWSRRARTGSTCKKRPDLLSVDFGVDRERPISPNPSVDEKPRVSSEEPTRPREWRQKIENWLQSNEQDGSDEYRRRSRRLAGNRRSFENDSENERNKLDTLPEEKPMTPSAVATTPSNEPYKRVYPDWKPSTASFDKPDIASTSNAEIDRDKSLWRKSNLNSPQSEGSYRLSHSRSRDSPLQSVAEEEHRKQTERRSSEAEYEPVYQKQEKQLVGITSDSHSIYIRPSSVNGTATSSPKSQDGASYNKIEIDSDNIETPPVTRRNIGSNKSLLAKSQANRSLARRISDDGTDDKENVNGVKSNEKVGEVDPLGDGQFDRYSAARRTRRYRRPTDHSSGNEDRNEAMSETPSPTDDENKIELKCDRTQPKSDTKHANILSRMGKVGQNLSSIDQEAVREAIRNLKSPTEVPERIWSPPREIVIKDNRISSSTSQPLKGAQHELNDEGFEETQSLVSDTPSHGKESTSSCNEPIDGNQTDNNREKIERTTSSESTTNDTSESQSSSKRRSIPKSMTMQKLIERNEVSLERSRSLRSGNLAAIGRSTTLPKRTNSLRKTEITSTHKRPVERSSSRNSLRSSRSSLNSSASTNTVKNMPLRPPSSLLSPKPKKSSPENGSSSSPASKLSTAKLSSASRAPASRSSSSGSSISASPRRNVSVKMSPSPTGKESRPAFRSAVSKSNQNSTSNRSMTSPSARLNNLTKSIATKTSSRVSNFMRPTTASATKISSNPKGK